MNDARHRTELELYWPSEPHVSLRVTSAQTFSADDLRELADVVEEIEVLRSGAVAEVES